MSKLETPLYDAIIQFQEKKAISFHVPGHKNGSVFFEKDGAFYKDFLSIDVTELSGLDDLHAPEGPILHAQKLLSELYRVKESYFLVNGTTVGNLAMILGVCETGDTVLVQRNCHKSVLHGLMMAKVKPIFLAPEYNAEWGVAEGVTEAVIEEALETYPDAKAVILTYPNYYGIGKNLKRIISMVHDKEIPVLIDEAHGAHFILGNPFLETSIFAGADIVVQSAHKTLPAMTMGSYLHINSDLVDKKKVEMYLNILQSSSPSYPIMASLDLARAYLTSYSEEDKKHLIRTIKGFRSELNGIPGIELLYKEEGLQDPLKLTIRSNRGLSGYELQRLLEREGVYPEMADAQNVLMILPLIKKESKYPLEESIRRIARATEAGAQTSEAMVSTRELGRQPALTQLSLSYEEMATRPKCKEFLEKCEGMIAAEMIIPYPPGIPLFMPGEAITKDRIDELKGLLAIGAKFQGGSDISKGKLWVYR